MVSLSTKVPFQCRYPGRACTPSRRLGNKQLADYQVINPKSSSATAVPNPGIHIPWSCCVFQIFEGIKTTSANPCWLSEHQTNSQQIPIIHVFILLFFTRASPKTSIAGLASLSAFSLSGSGSPAMPLLGVLLLSPSVFSGSRYRIASSECLWMAGRGLSS